MANYNGQPRPNKRMRKREMEQKRAGGFRESDQHRRPEWARSSFRAPYQRVSPQPPPQEIKQEIKEDPCSSPELQELRDQMSKVQKKLSDIECQQTRDQKALRRLTTFIVRLFDDHRVGQNITRVLFELASQNMDPGMYDLLKPMVNPRQCQDHFCENQDKYVATHPLEIMRLWTGDSTELAKSLDREWRTERERNDDPEIEDREDLRVEKKKRDPQLTQQTISTLSQRVSENVIRLVEGHVHFERQMQKDSMEVSRPYYGPLMPVLSDVRLIKDRLDWVETYAWDYFKQKDISDMTPFLVLASDKEGVTRLSEEAGYTSWESFAKDRLSNSDLGMGRYGNRVSPQLYAHLSGLPGWFDGSKDLDKRLGLKRRSIIQGGSDSQDLSLSQESDLNGPSRKILLKRQFLPTKPLSEADTMAMINYTVAEEMKRAYRPGHQTSSLLPGHSSALAPRDDSQPIPPDLPSLPPGYSKTVSSAVPVQRIRKRPRQGVVQEGESRGTLRKIDQEPQSAIKQELEKFMDAVDRQMYADEGRMLKKEKPSRDKPFNLVQLEGERGIWSTVDPSLQAPAIIPAEDPGALSEALLAEWEGDKEGSSGDGVGCGDDAEEEGEGQQSSDIVHLWGRIRPSGATTSVPTRGEKDLNPRQEKSGFSDSSTDGGWRPMKP